MTPLMPQCDASRLMPGEAVYGLFCEGDAYNPVKGHTTEPRPLIVGIYS